MRQPPQRESFERFYLTKVALGEGCGCAEHATRIRDLEAYADRSARRVATAGLFPSLANLVRPLWARLRRRPATPNPKPAAASPCP
jgi:hypothetical protein